MQDSSQSPITDKACLISIVVGGCAGVSAAFFRALIGSLPELVAPPKLQLLVILMLSLLAGLVTALVVRKHLTSRFQAPGVAGRLGIRAGLFCTILAGAILTLLATLDANGAESGALDRVLRARMWLVLGVSLTALLPGVLCGFVGGLIGGQIMATKLPEKPAEHSDEGISYLRHTIWGVMIVSLLGLLAPLTYMGRAPKVDPPVVVTPVDTPPPFIYEVPPNIKSAHIGQIQPDSTQMIEGVLSTGPVRLSADGRLFAYADAARSGAGIIIYDLHRLQKIGSFSLPAPPDKPLAWSPDQKALACAVSRDGDERIWILKLDGSQAIELPRPPGRDTPHGEFFWWEEHELAFFPTDEPPLVFDLHKLILSPLKESPTFTQLEKDQQQKWLDEPGTVLAPPLVWKPDIRTVIRIATPPPRRSPDELWQLGVASVCALAHPELPLAFGFDTLPVTEGTRVVFAADGSKIIRLANNRAEVTFMKVEQSPPVHFEVAMPVSSDAVQTTAWKDHIDAGRLCALVYEPLINPLTQKSVGPDYQKVRGLAQLVEWKGNTAVFVLQCCDRPLPMNSVASTLHVWNEARWEVWNEATIKDWWTAVKQVPRDLPDKLEVLDTPNLLGLADRKSHWGVVQASEAPRTRNQPQPQPATSASILSNQNPLSVPGLGGAPPLSSTPVQPSLSTSASMPSAFTPKRITATEVQTFLTDHHAKASLGDVAGMVDDYDQSVDFLDKGRLTRSAIKIEETLNHEKWPKSSEQVVGAIRAMELGDHWSAFYTISFRNENAKGEWYEGKADLEMKIRVDENDRLRIISQKAKVHDLVSSKTSGKASAGSTDQPARYSITVPRPCFVSVTRAKDSANLEFTDEISFVNGIVWHRTYRELSKDGKILRTCRAIYTGSGGVSPDRKTARIYVTTQEWDKMIGGGTFTGVCQRSAQSMVGKAFLFQFVNGGMVESVLGITFKLVK